MPALKLAFCSRLHQRLLVPPCWCAQAVLWAVNTAVIVGVSLLLALFILKLTKVRLLDDYKANV